MFTAANTAKIKCIANLKYKFENKHFHTIYYVILRLIGATIQRCIKSNYRQI